MSTNMQVILSRRPIRASSWRSQTCRRPPHDSRRFVPTATNFWCEHEKVVALAELLRLVRKSPNSRRHVADLSRHSPTSRRQVADSSAQFGTLGDVLGRALNSRWRRNGSTASLLVLSATCRRHVCDNSGTFADNSENCRRIVGDMSANCPRESPSPPHRLRLIVF